MGPDMLKEADEHQRVQEERMERDLADLRQLERLRGHAFMRGFCRWMEVTEHDHHGVEHFKKHLLKLLRGEP